MGFFGVLRVTITKCTKIKQYFEKFVKCKLSRKAANIESEIKCNNFWIGTFSNLSLISHSP